MIPWLLLKFIPALASVLHVGNRIYLYAFFGILILGSILVRYARAPTVRFQTFFAPTLCLLFAASLLPSLPATISTGSTAEVFPTARGLFLFASLLFLLRTPLEARFMLAAIVSGLAALQIAHLSTSLSIVSAGATHVEYNIDQQRIVGIANSPWTVSYASVVYVGICLFSAEIFGRRLHRLALYALSMVGLINIFLAVTRGAVLALGILLGLWGLEHLRARARRGKRTNLRRPVIRLMWALLVSIFALGIAVTLYPEAAVYYYDLWMRRFEPGLAGESSRWASNLSGLRMFAENPIFGVGWERAYLLSEQYGTAIPMTVHNGLIQAAAQGGIAGLLFAIVLLFILPLRLFWRYRALPGSFVFLGTWCAVIAYNMLASNFMLESHFDVLFAWILCLGSRNCLRQSKTDCRLHIPAPAGSAVPRNEKGTPNGAPSLPRRPLHQ